MTSPVPYTEGSGFILVTNDIIISDSDDANRYQPVSNANATLFGSW